ncbi:hypothetical protein [Salinibacter ruber]|uniref:hypothetical protein n=1 Tax=Salinibacter ruber TaxID=146919 RepID=UPI0021675AAC|nr:hypothetical protein [Salinibacter ruber]MCS3824359.1 hypothetical protein [Salinibacter ruber]
MADTPPVLLLIFNRPDLTEQVMEQIRKAEPAKLFIGADGPRADHPGDKRNCQQARDVATRVDWDCEVHTLFRGENLSCKQAVSSAISWFFEHVEAGIILEDDCVPHPSFFPYCAELLERYRNDDRVMVVSGNNFQPEETTWESSYYYSIYNHCWGWATWRRAWQHYDGDIADWSDLRDTEWLEGWVGSEEGAKYWTGIFDQVAQDAVDSWAYPWTFSCWAEHGLSILPQTNLVTNIGFGERATHTKNTEGTDGESDGHRPARSLSFPLSHPNRIVRDYEADEYTLREHFGVRVPSPRWYRLADRFTPELVKKAIQPIYRFYKTKYKNTR